MFEGILDDDDNDAENNDNIDVHDSNAENKNAMQPKREKLKSNDVENDFGSPRILQKYEEDSFNTPRGHESTNDKENLKPIQNINITPGAIMLTPTAKSVGPTPDRSVSI